MALLLVSWARRLHCGQPRQTMAALTGGAGCGIRDSSYSCTTRARLTVTPRIHVARKHGGGGGSPEKA